MFVITYQMGACEQISKFSLFWMIWGKSVGGGAVRGWGMLQLLYNFYHTVVWCY